MLTAAFVGVVGVERTNVPTTKNTKTQKHAKKAIKPKNQTINDSPKYNTGLPW